MEALSKRHVLSGTADHFVQDQVRIDFVVKFNHSRGISQKQLQESLRRVADPVQNSMVTRLHRRNPSRSAQTNISNMTAGDCQIAKLESKCTESCAAYVSNICLNCECDEIYGGTPQCICILDQSIMSIGLVSNSLFAGLMFIFGLCIRTAVLKRAPLKRKTPWPQISPDGLEEQFQDGIFDCCGDTNSFIMVCCCPAVRAAMTYYYAGWSKGYVRILLIMCLVWAFPAYMSQGLIPLVLYFGRRHIRKSAPMTPDCWTDCFCVCCCSLCVLCQEARHVDACLEERKRKEMEDSGDLIGQAVAIEGATV